MPRCIVKDCMSIIGSGTQDKCDGCRIKELTAENARLRRQVERLVPLVRYAMAESIAGVVEALQDAGLCKRGVDATEFGRRIARESHGIQVEIDAILADEPGETE